MRKLHPLSVNRTRYQRLSALASPAVAAVLVAVAPRLALAAQHALCLRWRVDAIDRTAGNLTETTALQWPARGTRVQVTDSTSGAILINGRTTTTDACLTFQVFGLPGDPTPPTKFRNVRVYYDTRVGTPSAGQTTGRVQARGFFTQTEDLNDTDVSVLIQNVGFALQNDGTYKATVDVGSGVAPMSISMASVSHTLHRVDTALTASAKPPAPPLLKVILQDCNYQNNWSCTNPSIGKIWLTPDATNGSTSRKFVSGHEVGHWLDYHWGGVSGTSASTGGSPDYSFSATATEQAALRETCRFTWDSNNGQGNQAHAMRSQEYQHAAVREAFAHFMALFSFNEASATSNAQFRYYKTEAASAKDGSYPATDIYFAATTYTSSFLPIPFSFLDSTSGCDCTTLGNCDGTSTEMQWMRAYWWYLIRDEPGGTKPTLTDLFVQMQAVPKSATGVSCNSSTDKCYGAVTSVIPATFLARWQSVGATMGLATDNP